MISSRSDIHHVDTIGLKLTPHYLPPSPPPWHQLYRHAADAVIMTQQEYATALYAKVKAAIAKK